jgi:hypothetical protein
MICPHRKPKGKDLTSKQKLENQKLQTLRGSIENDFGSLKNRFLVLGSSYRAEKKWFNTVFKNCLALDNLQRFPDNIKDYWGVVTNFFTSPDMDIESEEENSSDSSN